MDEKIDNVMIKLCECENILEELQLESILRQTHSALSESIRNINNIKRLLTNISGSKT